MHELERDLSRDEWMREHVEVAGAYLGLMGVVPVMEDKRERRRGGWGQDDDIDEIPSLAWTSGWQQRRNDLPSLRGPGGRLDRWWQ